MYILYIMLHVYICMYHQNVNSDYLSVVGLQL